MARLRLTFVGLIAAATAALAGLTSALTRPASPATGLAVAASGLVLVISLGLCVRLLLATDRARPNDPISTGDR